VPDLPSSISVSKKLATVMFVANAKHAGSAVTSHKNVQAGYGSGRIRN
jgi:hypothetical protein